jgi:hypothetical protein
MQMHSMPWPESQAIFLSKTYLYMDMDELCARLQRTKASIHMPRAACRMLLEITGVRVERLNSISQEDAQAEGMELTGWRPTYSDPDSGGEVWTPYDNFAQLWESIYGEESWKANPWVWVIEFKVVPNVPANSTWSDLR